jgi:hypothetical protein
MVSATAGETHDVMRSELTFSPAFVVFPSAGKPFGGPCPLSRRTNEQISFDESLALRHHPRMRECEER